jgi:O-Antigen ligase
MFVTGTRQFATLPSAAPRRAPSVWIAALAVAAAMAVVLGIALIGWKIIAIVVALGGGLLLVRFPEVALGCLMVIGSFKAAPQFDSLPVDPTLVFVVVLMGVIGIRLCRKSTIPLPWELSLYLPIVLMMLLSLLYTPNLSGGLEKTARFVIINGVSILAPFAVLDSPAKFKRFFMTLLAAGFIASLTSLNMLGGHERLTTPGGDTIQLGHDAALGIAILWFGLLPGQKIPIRIGLYAALGVMLVAMLGSGSRGPFIGLAACILLSVWYRRRIGFRSRQLIFDFGALVILGALLLTVVSIPQESLAYLARLGDVQSATAFLGPRAALSRKGWQLTLEHPLRGVGIDGFPVLFTGIGNWPHSIPIELSSELGVGAALSFICLQLVSLRTSLKEFFLADERWRSTASLVLCFMVTEAISMLNTGNVNDNRELWACLSLPFVLRYLRKAEPDLDYA